MGGDRETAGGRRAGRGGRQMLDGTFVTITRLNRYREGNPFAVGKVLLCCKEPDNPYDTEAIRVLAEGGQQVGYLANSVSTKANGTMSAARVYDRVGDCFAIEVCFSTQTKVICQVVCFDVRDGETRRRYTRPE